MTRRSFCPTCMNAFTQNVSVCPNLVCEASRPPSGWGKLLESGDTLDRRYRIHSRLAVGGAGITYRARELDDDDRLVGPELAIKVLIERGGSTHRRRLANEARVLQDLDHPHIVSCRGFVERTGHPPYLVMTFEAGGNLFDHVRQHGTLSAEASLGVFEQLLNALDAAHRRSVIHRDLKPQNLLLRTSTARDVAPHILVADFGIAKLQGFAGENLTTAGMFVGTPEFAAPEQFKGLPPAPAADVWAAGAILWFCLTGAPPVKLPDRTDLVACLRALREGLPPKLPDGLAPPERRSGLQALLDGVLCGLPTERWSLAKAIEKLGASAPQPLPTAPMGTMTPEALMMDSAPEPVPRTEAEPAPVVPPSEPRGRIRLDEPVSQRPEAQPARPRSTDDSLDALFESQEAAQEGVVHVPPTLDTLSLDDLFSAVPASPPDPVAKAAHTEALPEEPAGSVLDAHWETMTAAPQAPLPPPAPPRRPPPPWEPAHPEQRSANTDSERIQALGRCSTGDRSSLFEALEDPNGAVGDAGTDPVCLCGAALTVGHFALKARANWARQKLKHPDPNVRATMALAVAAVGAASQLTLLNRLLEAPEPVVRIAAIHALRQLGSRLGRESVVDDWLQRVANDPDERVQALL